MSFRTAGIFRDSQSARHREDGRRGQGLRQHVPAAARPRGRNQRRTSHLSSEGTSRGLLQGKTNLI